MAECSFARCQQERRAIRKELQRWTKNMVYVLGLERVAEELMGRRKWKLYQDALLPRSSEPGESSDEEPSMPAEAPPAIKIKTIEEINTAPDGEGSTEPPPRQETILESLIKRPAAHPKLEFQEEPADWKPQDKCYFCVDGERPEPAADHHHGAPSPVSESDSSSVSGAHSPGALPLLQHLLQFQNQNPQAVVQFQQMMAALAALGSGLVPPALSQAMFMQRVAQQTHMLQQQHVDRLTADMGEKVSVSNSSPSLLVTGPEQPLDLSAKSSSETPPPEGRLLDNRLKRAAADSAATRRAYSEDELQSALRDIQAGRLGTRRAAVLYGIPRSTLRNKVYKLASEPERDSDDERAPEPDDDAPNVILKIPSFPPPDERASSPTRPPAPLQLPLAVYADRPPAERLFSLRDVIAKSISQKFQQPLERPPQDAAYQRAVSVIKTPPGDQRNFGAGNSRGANNGTVPAGGKGTRPKRGKYRNYDRDSLVEAVKAVQRGEMSVHRAGSYYGVPHSTLEYKVKERHLMRPRKREPKPPQELKPQVKPQPKPPAKPYPNGLNGPETPGGYAPGYPFWPGAGFPPPPTPEQYSSHMMRRLQSDAAPMPANGSFLEGIIRSSLERPPALIQRLSEPPHGRGVEAPSLLRRLAGEREESPPPARRPRLSSSDRQLAAEMREAVQRLRADKTRRSTPTPPPAPPAPLAPRAPSPPADRV